MSFLTQVSILSPESDKMGTIMSIVPLRGLGDTPSLDESFEEGLRAAVRASSEHTQLRSRYKAQYPLGIFQKLSSLSTEEGDGWNEANNNNFENQNSSSQDCIPIRKALKVPTESNVSNTANDSRQALDINRNVTREEKAENMKASHALNAEATKQQTNAKKPFQPESWPTMEMIQDHLVHHKEAPTTLIFARFLANRQAKKYVEIRYSTTGNTNETILECSDKLETLITPKEQFKTGDTEDEKIKYFLLIFKTCINNLQGQVWWNGFSFILDSNLKNRLKVSALETHPISQLLFELSGMKELEIHRTLHRIELRGEIEGSPENAMKYIRFRGVSIKDIQVKQLRGNLITLHIPPFSSDSIEYWLNK